MSATNKNLLRLTDLGAEEIEKIFSIAHDLKKNPYQKTLQNKVIGMFFAKSSTRTRVSFETGIYHLGGNSMFFSPNEIQIGRGETIEDTARVLDRYLDGFVIRTYDHQDVETFAKYTRFPVINGLTDLCHPCQVLTDLFTIEEKFGTFKNKKIVYIGDCNNNMAYSWMIGAALMGCELILTGHPDYQPTSSSLKEAQTLSEPSGAKIQYIKDPMEAINSAHILYTDVWTSMGQEEESEKRKKDLSQWQVNEEKLRKAHEEALFMHCLPAHRGEEVSHDVLEGPQSIVFDQAENRLHVQKAIMTHLFL